MKHRLRRLATNPLTLIVPVIIILAIGWRQYIHAGLNLSVPDAHSNLLPNGNFNRLSGGLPLWWQVQKSGDASYIISRGSGYVGGNTLELNVKKYASGAVTLVSPKVTLTPNQTYLYKGYYRSYMRFAFLARYFYKDGTSKLVYLRDYRDDSGTWSTVSDAFTSGETVEAVQYIYRITTTGLLEVNGVYLEPKHNVYISPVVGGKNIIPNNRLAATCNPAIPDSWTPYHTGSNTAAFWFNHDATGAYVQVSLDDYKNGEAKWQYPPLAVRAAQRYQFSVDYKSDVASQMIAEYVMTDGKRQFETVATLAPSGDWTGVAYPFEVPLNAKTMFVSVVLKQSGTLATRNHSLVNITKTGALYWRRPLVSITFDDGWQSAYTDARPLLEKYGFDATFYINPSSIETSNFMTAAELHALADAGNEIAAHGYSHDDMTAIDDKELNHQLREGRDYLRRAGFTVTDFATPYGNSDAEVQWYARNDFKTMRGTETGLNTRQNLNPYDLKILYIDATTVKEMVATALRQAQASRGWLILVYHRVGGANDASKSLKVENTTVSSDAFRDQVNLIKQSHIAVLPVAAAYAGAEKQGL